jgi:tetratricopeptide (TPR) repeat protein/transcriptional regulator with XRE-family HTH domain
MADQPSVPFAGLLRALRTEAGLTQEELAEAARVSVRSISDLERGINLTARKETSRLLADALQLDGQARSSFEAAARGIATSARSRTEASATGTVAVATRTLPRDVTSFTGRTAELRELIEMIADGGSSGSVGICAIGGMAGIGKTAFAVHAAHLLVPQFPDGQIYLPLHGHTPGQQPVDPADALASLLLTAGVAAPQIPPGIEARTRLWRDHLAGMRLLLVLDDAAGHEQVRPLLPGTAGNLVLVTSRRHLTALEDTHTISLDTLPPHEAEELLIRLADRPGLDLGDASVAEITRLCGYLPLAVGMIARQLHHHPAWGSARLAADLTSARDRLAFMHAENLSVAAAFDLSYQDLTLSQRQLFRRLGLHPGTEIDAYSAAALDDTDVRTAQHHLDALYDQHLTTEPGHGRYRLHDLIREHARTLAAQDPVADSDRAFGRLLDYYLNTALAASRHMARRSPRNAPAAAGPATASGPDLPTYEDAVAWLNAERLNLHAAASSASLGGRRRYAFAIPAAMHGFLRSHGHWDQALSLHRLALQAASDADDQLAEAGALTDLGEIQQLTGEYSLAQASLNQALELYRTLGDQAGQASALNELGVVQFGVDDYLGATSSHEQALRLYRTLGNRAGEASALNELGLVQRATGDYRAATQSHEQALRHYRDLGNRIGEASALNRLGQMQRSTGDYPGAVTSQEQALRLHRDLGNRIGEATALYGLGIVHQAAGRHQASVASHEQALRLYRDLDYRFGEATALTGLGAAQIAIGNHAAAAASYEQALRLNRDLGNRMGQATALNGLGAAHRAAEDLSAARASHELALRLCRDTGHKPGEADALHAIGIVQLAVGDYQAATANVLRALDLYRELGVLSGEAEALNTEGELLLACAKPDEALSRHRRALAIAASINLREQEARALDGIDRCHRQAGGGMSASAPIVG